jgi:hypothetical protein
MQQSELFFMISRIFFGKKVLNSSLSVTFIHTSTNSFSPHYWVENLPTFNRFL